MQASAKDGVLEQGSAAGAGVGSLDYRPHRLIRLLAPLFDGLAQALGPNYEIVLHDLRHPDHSVCSIAGAVTGRSVGAPATNVLLESLRSSGNAAEDIFNYSTTANGRPIRSSVLFLRDGGQVVGAVCVNVDVGPLVRVKDELELLIGLDRGEDPRAETFENTVGALVEDLLAATFAKIGLRRAHTTPQERLQVVASLEEQGAFQVKGAVELVARELDVSKFTIYSYLQRLRGSRGAQRRTNQAGRTVISQDAGRT
ncbi:MAG: PAS domain-containing protein [Candidatus Limnocylindrales bacterium]|jgi:predicted transcriptional regulator YheO